MAQSRKRRRQNDRAPSPATDPAMTRYRLWVARVTRAKKVRKEWEEKYQVKTCGEYFLGAQLPQGDDQGRVMNHFHATIKVIKPNLIFQHPKFYVRAKPGQGDRSTRHAAIGEGVLEAIGSQDDNLKISADLGVNQSFYRVGVLKVCYEPTMTENPKKGQPIFARDANGSPIEVERDGKKELLRERDPSTGKELTEPDEIASDEIYRYKWVDARYMIFPDAGPDITCWPWVGEEVTVKLEDAKEDTRFPANLRRQFVSNVTRKGEDKPPVLRGEPLDEDDADFRYVEIYDIDKHERKIYADGQDFEGFILEDETPDGIEDHPYAILTFNDIIEPEPSPWPLPLVYPWLDVQAEYNVKRRQVTEGGKRAARKVVYFEGTFDDSDEAAKLLQDPLDMQAVKCLSPELLPQVMDVPPVSSDIYRDIQLLQHDWQVITGQSGARLGGAEGQTATENIFIERAANLRDAELQGRVQAWLATAGRKMWQLVRQTLTLGLWIKLRNYDDAEFKTYVQSTYGVDLASIAERLPGVKEIFKEQYGEDRPLEVSREDLAFEADITVVPGSQRPQTLEAEKRSVFEFLTLIGSSPQLALSRGLLLWVASKFDPPLPATVIDELHALAKTMVGINANQAGRTQGANSGTANGGGPNGNAGGAADPMLGMNPVMQAMSNGGL